MLISFIVCNYPAVGNLANTLDSILNQETGAAECFVIDDIESEDISGRYTGKVACWERVARGEQVNAANRAFAQSRGSVSGWLSSADKLCPWTSRLVSFVMEHLPQVQWLTSGTPLAWTPTQMCVPNGLADGYAKRAFFAGRNLKTSSYFHFPIWRGGTFWRRELWQASGGKVRYPLHEAGDFELWTRYWEHADLVTLHVPLAGTQIGTPQIETEAYWSKASEYLKVNGGTAAPSRLRRPLQSQLMRRIPSLRAKWGQSAPLVWISPPTLECGLSARTIL